MGTNKILIFSAIVIIILTIIVLSTGGVRKDITLKNYELSRDGVTMVLKVSTSNKMKHTRKMKVTKEGNDLFIKFYSSFGYNSRSGNKNTYNVDIVNIDEIYFYIGEKGYRKVLELRGNTWREPYDEMIVK